MMSVPKKLLSYLWPVTEWSGPGKHGPLILQWDVGRLVVNSSNANQSHGTLHQVWRQCLRKLRVKELNPERILILGFGAGSAAIILRKELHLDALMIGVDDDPEMLRIARRYFKVDELPRLRTIQIDAREFVAQATEQYDLILVDLWEDHRLAKGVDEAPFINHLRNCTSPDGLVCFNTMDHDQIGLAQSQRVARFLRRYFNRCRAFRFMGGNQVFVASKPIAC